MAETQPAVPAPGAGLPAEFASWPAFYAALTAGGEIGFRPVADYRKAAAIVSGLAVSLNEVMTKAFAEDRVPNVITIFADVLTDIGKRGATRDRRLVERPLRQRSMATPSTLSA